MSANIFFGEVGDTTFASVADFDVTPATIVHTSIFGGEDDIRVTGSFFSFSAAGLTGDSLATLLEPGCTGTLCASDYIHVRWTTRAAPGTPFSIVDIVAEFGSDPEALGGSAHCLTAPATCVVETGGVQDITGLLTLPANITMQAQSDIEVPEPAALALVGLGLLGLRASRRKAAA
ncbi:MAG: PEP-CTERM sorting domain-containing protein [Burkholderiales bacterium]|nr:PEP-CTERM sorting domain-containing protein [Burkholderiales bacterium]